MIGQLKKEIKKEKIKIFQVKGNKTLREAQKNEMLKEYEGNIRSLEHRLATIHKLQLKEKAKNMF